MKLKELLWIVFLGLALTATLNLGYKTLAWTTTHVHDSVLYIMKILGELEIAEISSDGTGKVVCIKSDKNLGTCTDQPDTSGVCTCN